MNGIIEIGSWRLLVAYFFLIVLLILIKGLEIGKEKEIIIATLRMTVQLVAVGYALDIIFNQSQFYISLLILILMQYFAIRNIYSRVKMPLNNKLRRVVVFSMLTGTTLTIFFFLVLVINLKPWYEPRYFLPITGMIIGNSMTGISLGVERLISGVTAKKELIEGALMLGATPKDATLDIVKDAFTSAIMPTINSMVGMGIVFLPGMMTGQILSGVSPLVAIEYQIAIMLGIIGSVSITVFILVRLGCQTFFNRWSQLEDTKGMGTHPW
ncbi:MAG: iron export ABC transporter permease subunit FetB [Dethiobacter sp.]|jgi:putative ABC transport system permease protein|nr:MAG: iron export ABC transporter permease subunit FetB [Dethiobacter sp.]